MEKINLLTRADYKEAFALSEFAFQETSTEEERVEGALEADRHEIWGYQINGDLAGKLHIVPLEVNFQGKRYEMGGISDVATWPEYRRSGIAKKLLYHALEKMKDNGQVVSYLYPFSVGFYRKYGWELVIDRREDLMPIDQLKRDWDGEGFVRRVKDDISTMDSIYTSYANKLNGMLVRDTFWWQHRVLADKEMNVAIAYNSKKEAEGYIVFKVRNNLLTVKEIIYATLNGRNLLYEFIANHDSMAENVKWIVPTNNPVPFMVNNPTYEQKIKPYFMARIVDVAAFLQQYVYTQIDGNITFTVEDAFFTENSATYTVKVVGGQAVQVEKGPKEKDAQIHCSINYLTTMYFGYKRPLELYDQKLISGDKAAIAQLETMLPRANTFLADFF